MTTKKAYVEIKDKLKALVENDFLEMDQDLIQKMDQKDTSPLLSARDCAEEAVLHWLTDHFLQTRSFEKDDFVDYGIHPGGLKKVPNGGEIYLKMKGTLGPVVNV